jgi:hypothetical protein
MPQFFFDYRTENYLERDDEGITFPSITAAYEDALQAAAEMRAEACCEGRDAANESFEIRDEAGRMVLVLPFTEAVKKS